jgi:hypothetical protein
VDIISHLRAFRRLPLRGTSPASFPAPLGAAVSFTFEEDEETLFFFDFPARPEQDAALFARRLDHPLGASRFAPCSRVSSARDARALSSFNLKASRFHIRLREDSFL